MARHTPGNYVPLDVNYVRDAAIRRAGEAAELLFIRSLAYAKGAKSRGRIPDYDLDVIAVGMKNVPTRVAALVAHSLWIEVEGGWEIRSWSQWNSANEHESEAGRKAAHVRHHVNAGVRSQDCSYCDSDAIASAVVDAPASESHMQGKGREGKGSSTRASAGRKKAASPLPDDWTPTETHQAYAVEHQLDLAAEVFKFRNHAVANDRRQVVWNAAFSTWLGNAVSYRGPSRPQAQQIDLNPWMSR